MNRGSWLSCIAVLVFSIAAWWQSTAGFRAFTTESARRIAVVENHRQLANYRFQDQDGKLVSLSDFKGKLILLDFIYTRCPDICHSLGFQFKTLLTELEHAGLKDKVSLLSVSFDPEHDSAENLQSYLKRYVKDNHSWNGLRPIARQELDSMLKEFGVVVLTNEQGGFDHNAAIHLIDESGSLVGIYDFQATQQIIAEIKRINEMQIL